MKNDGSKISPHDFCLCHISPTISSPLITTLHHLTNLYAIHAFFASFMALPPFSIKHIPNPTQYIFLFAIIFTILMILT